MEFHLTEECCYVVGNEPALAEVMAQQQTIISSNVDLDQYAIWPHNKLSYLLIWLFDNLLCELNVYDYI